MGQIRPWQIALFVAAIAALAFSAWWSRSGTPQPKSTHRVVMVDVTTGDLFEFSTRRASVIVPERNPETGRVALFPVSKSDDGRWVVDRRYLDSLDEVEGEPAMLLDERSGEVRVNRETPKKAGTPGRN